MPVLSIFGRLNRLLIENHVVHGIIAAVVVFAVKIGFDVATGKDPSVLEAVVAGVVLGAIYYGGLKYGAS
ncbi:ComEC/Rec2-related domain-containing protein [Natrinema pellirubrum DSM 15624]|uniref:ComEC/Rec2-related domain-containing protein n=1 Tax=Natrinema pellirubrum (strain DSM 15624 / CIP 106293 / JCM 10476 / NCIMB 786 / 157) TaxID=797303 RepID=L0JT96_NATP1|nr:hypothetical protein [Natrinema pellirubrum]AGB33616.1 hypothetical protein Natpe_3857 [Natrinema pellirubrum DSM 15624]ELY70473.1 ComEC/Rec2-related domain-containing protein [Natrinema pellirubrum DSM 15624]